MKTLLRYLFILLSSATLWSQSITINEAAGWLESAYVKWQPVTGATSYNVYYTGEGIINQKIDNQLIRSYGSYFRADVLGLKAGTYTITVKALISGIEEVSGTTTSSITVLAQDRTGFAFSNGRIPGAYNTDGTIKAGTVIIYITENTKNTVSMNVTGANSNPCIGLQTILDGFKKGNDTRPLIIRLIGQVTDFDYMLNGDIVIENKQNANSHITFEGVGEDAVADGWGIRIKNASNIEIRNIGTMNCNSGEGDNIGLQQDNDYIWVHNVDFFYGDAGGDADQAKGDGALDCKKSTYVTFSYNHFWDSGKSNLLGLSEDTTTGLYITYHHNWYDHSDSRHPRVRFYSAHVYNNYYDGNAKYGIGSTLGSSVFSEANYYRNCKFPMLTSMQGSDVYESSTGQNDPANNATFSKEDGGVIKSFNNYMIGQNRFVAYGDSNPAYNTIYISSISDFDAYVATTRGEQIPSFVVSKLGSNTYNNFDTDPTLYVKNLVVDTPDAAKNKVIQYSGRMHGGDFSWTFNNAIDDTAYAVNAPLKTALVNYKTSLVYVQGEPVPSSHLLTVSTSNANQTIIEGNTLETINLTWGGDATDATVNGLPSSGLSYVKNSSAKTITITGTPTTDVSYTVTTVGTGIPVSESGTITVIPIGSPPTGDIIHNFTESDLNNTFYSISGNLSTSKGTVIYDGLTLTQCMKMESSAGVVTFTTSQVGTLTLVMNVSSTNATAYAKIDGTNYTDASGVITVSIPAGSHTISKSSTSNLFYIKTSFGTLGLDDIKSVKLDLYPNPVIDSFSISTNVEIENVTIYNMLGELVKSFEKNTNNFDISYLNTGTYLVKIQSNKGSIHKIIIKN